MTVAPQALLDDLRRFLARPVVIVGVGSELRGDDVFGILAARELRSGDPMEGVEVLEGGVAPENLAERIARSAPRTVLVLDSARLEGARPGELRLMGPRELDWPSASTHAPSLGLLAEYVARRCGAETVLLVCMPGGTAFGEAPCGAVVEAARAAAGLVRRALGLWQSPLS